MVDHVAAAAAAVDCAAEVVDGATVALARASAEDGRLSVAKLDTHQVLAYDLAHAASAIEGCRTAALGGHVARCENPACGHTAIAYNSCGNRHCPKCQGSQARE